MKGLGSRGNIFSCAGALKGAGTGGNSRGNYTISLGVEVSGSRGVRARERMEFVDELELRKNAPVDIEVAQAGCLASF